MSVLYFESNQSLAAQIPDQLSDEDMRKVCSEIRRRLTFVPLCVRLSDSFFLDCWATVSKLYPSIRQEVVPVGSLITETRVDRWDDGVCDLEDLPRRFVIRNLVKCLEQSLLHGPSV